MKKIGRYEFTNTLHQGDGATIYLAYDPVFECDVAIKVIKLDRSDGLRHNTNNVHQEIEREASAIMSLKHARILPLYDVRIEKEQLYLVMPYLSGGSLATRIEKQAFSSREAIELIRQLTPGLELAHSKGIIHRNLKPTNVLFDEEQQPYLTDFALANLEYYQNVTHSISSAYISPEQAAHAHKIDQRSDIYALGVMLFELLTGSLPYQANQPRGMAYKHLYHPIPTPSALQANLPSIYDQLIKQAIAKAPSARYNNIGQLNVALDEIIADEQASIFYASIPYIPAIEREVPQPAPPLDHNKSIKTRTPTSYRPKKVASDETNHSPLSDLWLKLQRLFIILRTWPGLATLGLLLTILILLLVNMDYIFGIIARSYWP